VIKLSTFLIAAAIAGVAVLPMPRPAQADTGSTIAIAAAAALVVGAILTDSNNQPYYVDNGRHVYVSQSTATYYRSHGNGNGNGRGRMQQQHNYGNQQQWNQRGDQRDDRGQMGH
jgi:hypothetical protein